MVLGQGGILHVHYDELVSPLAIHNLKERPWFKLYLVKLEIPKMPLLCRYIRIHLKPY